MPRQHYVILGAGISGLALAWFLKQRYQDGIELTILESTNRPGGWIQTKSHDTFLFEQGPRSFRPEGSGIATLQLIEELGLKNAYISASPAAKKRYLYVEGQLQSLPTSLSSFLSSPFLFPIVKALWKDWRAPKSLNEDESIYSFVERRFGSNIADLFFDPLLSGIYAGNIHKLSLKACFPWLDQLEKQHRCIWLGALTKKKKNHKESLSSFVENARKQGIFSLKNGTESLIHALAEKLKLELKLECSAKKIFFENGRVMIELQNGETLFADRIFSALPAKKLASILSHTDPLFPKNLEAIPTTSIATINVGYHSSVLQREGFGYLIPSKEKQKLLGVVWDSSAFPQQNAHVEQTRLTAMLGGTRFVNFAKTSDQVLIEMTLLEIERHLGIKQTPDYISIKRSIEAIPQYSVGHHARLLEIENAIKRLPGNLHLLGNAFYGISVNDCIAHAKKIATNLSYFP